jgi:hypothetical protein
VQRVAFDRYADGLRGARGDAAADSRRHCDGSRPGAPSRCSDAAELTRRLVVRENTLRSAIALNMRHRRVRSSGEDSVEHGRRSVRPTMQEQHGERDDTCDRRTIHRSGVSPLQLG